MREKKLIVLVALVVLIPALAFADCSEPAGASLVSKDLVNQTGKISDLVTEKLTAAELDLLSERVIDLKNAAEIQKGKAEAFQKDLESAGDCGDGLLKLSKAQCIQKQIDLLTARSEVMSDEAKAKTQDQIAELKLQLTASKAMIEASQNYDQASSTLQEMVGGMKKGDFSYKEHLTIIGKALLGSWKQLLTPGPIIAVSAGMAGYGVSRLTPLNNDAKDFYTNNPAPSTVSKITDQIGYAYPVLAPFLIVAAITKNNETMKTFDALAVGTAVSETIVEPLKYIAQEKRPNGVDNLGFPSAHATQTFMMATVLDHEYPGHHHIVGIAATAGAALVSFYRVQEGNHTPGEIFAGMGIGIATGIAASRAVDSEFAAAEGHKRAYYKDAMLGNFRIGKTDKVVHCVPMGLMGSCELTW